MCSERQRGIYVFEDKAFQTHMLVVSFAVILAGLGIFMLLAYLQGISAVCAELAHTSGLVWGISTLLAIVCAFLLHEGVHALFFKLFAPKGAKVEFGACLDMGLLYATAPGIIYTRQQYQLIAIAPSVAVTLLTAALGVWAGVPLAVYVVAVAHLSGCVGDWLYLWELHRQRDVLHCEDTSWGVRFLTGDEWA